MLSRDENFHDYKRQDYCTPSCSDLEDPFMHTTVIATSYVVHALFSVYESMSMSSIPETVFTQELI